MAIIFGIWQFGAGGMAHIYGEYLMAGMALNICILDTPICISLEFFGSIPSQMVALAILNILCRTFGIEIDIHNRGRNRKIVKIWIAWPVGR